MAPPHLHPRSRSTSLLFSSTLLAAFIVVGLPHIYPCPAPRKRLADSSDRIIISDDSQQQQALAVRRKAEEGRRREEQLVGSHAAEDDDEGCGKEMVGSVRLRAQRELLLRAQEEAKVLDKSARECPVPKPSGVLGSILGFSKGTDGGAGGGGGQNEDEDSVR